MDRWLVITNCTVNMLASCFSLLNPNVEVLAETSSNFSSHYGDWKEKLNYFEYIFYAPETVPSQISDLKNRENTIELPVFFFRAYHPDQCWVRVDEAPVPTPLFHYHSKIAASAFKRGLSEDETLSLYNEKTYQICGFFCWDEEKKKFLKRFEDRGYDISKYFRKWTMHDVFMYNLTNPRVECLLDIATDATEKTKRKPLISEFVPLDALANSARFPVYTELADYIGVSGSYYFKLSERNKIIDLKAFVHACFDQYHQHDAAKLTISSGVCPEEIFSN